MVDYWVVPDWLPAGLATTQPSYQQADPSPGQRLPAGLHSITVRARNAAGLSSPVTDTILVAYTNPKSPHPSGEMGVTGAVLSCSPVSGIRDVVGFRYHFRIAENAGHWNAIKAG